MRAPGAVGVAALLGIEEARMSLRKSFGVIALGALAGAHAFGCSSTPSNTTNGDDSGLTGSDGGKHEGGVHTDAQAPVCPPADVSTFMPPAYIPAKRTAAACTTAQISAFYDGCLAPNSTMTTCAPFSSTGSTANKACAACIVTPATAMAYGALLEQKGLVSINIPGCMEIKDAMGGLSCAKAYQASEKCNDIACATNCPVTDDASFQAYQQCTQVAATTGCKTFTTAAGCADDEADGGAASICFQGQSFQDLYNNVVPVFCL